jgi:cAMP phosphodiesterase
MARILNSCSLAEGITYHPIAKDISVRPMSISHGMTTCSKAPYSSTAYFIRHDPSSKEFLFFGDVDPDMLSLVPRNIDVWQAAAPKIPHILNTIFIECSYPVGRSDDQLYGHLNPEHLATELCILAQEVVKARRGERTGSTILEEQVHQRRNNVSPSLPFEELHGALLGVRVFIIHCKEDLVGRFEEPINLVIASQVRSLVEQQGLGLEIVAAEQGMHISERRLLHKIYGY